MRGYFMALDARTGTILWRFQTGSGIIGSPITYELDGTQYVAVPSGGIGGDMTFYYTEPKAGNLWVFALDGGGPARVAPGANLTTLEGGLPRIGEPGHTLGGRVIAGYGFPATEGTKPIRTEGAVWAADGGMTNPFAGQEEAIAQGGLTYRSRCVSCHKGGAGVGPNVFRSPLAPRHFVDTVTSGRPGIAMLPFGELLSRDDIWRVHAFLMSRDSL